MNFNLIEAPMMRMIVMMMITNKDIKNGIWRNPWCLIVQFTLDIIIVNHIDFVDNEL